MIENSVFKNDQYRSSRIIAQQSNIDRIDCQLQYDQRKLYKDLHVNGTRTESSEGKLQASEVKHDIITLLSSKSGDKSNMVSPRFPSIIEKS